MSTFDRPVPERRREASIAQAEAYVRTRFFPPLPVEYGALAVEAVEAVNGGYPNRRITVGHLDVVPKGAAADGKISALALVSALRLDHMIDDDDEED